MGVKCSIDGCERRGEVRGWCAPHYKRWLRHGDPLGSGVQHPVTEPVVRFMRKAEKNPTTGCWDWTASRQKHGYGLFWPGGTSKSGLAHRWSYAHHVGPIPEGLFVLHRCDNPGCVNPDHLFLGTQADNVADCIKKGRRSQVRYRKLSPEQRGEIKDLYATGRFTLSDLGRRYGVSYTSIRYHV